MTNARQSNYQPSTTERKESTSLISDCLSVSINIKPLACSTANAETICSLVPIDFKSTNFCMRQKAKYLSRPTCIECVSGLKQRKRKKRVVGMIYVKNYHTKAQILTAHLTFQMIGSFSEGISGCPSMDRLFS